MRFFLKMKIAYNEDTKKVIRKIFQDDDSIDGSLFQPEPKAFRALYNLSPNNLICYC